MKWRLVGSLVGTVLVIAGAFILIGTVASVSYSQIEQSALANQAAEATHPVQIAPSVPSRSAATSGAKEPSSAAVTHSFPLPAPIERITAPSISLDAKVAEAPLVNGQWAIPKFEAGHLQGTAQPLSGGNVVLAGHVQSITSGDVFAHIGDLKPGDTIHLYTQASTITYVVQDVKQVQNTDLSVLASGKHETLTLITCSGTWLPLQHDYSDRIVVVAVPVRR